MEVNLFPYIHGEIKPHLLNPEITSSEVISCLKEIQSGFTKSRGNIAKYVEEVNTVSSYCFFYLPTDFPKLSFVLKNLAPEVISALREKEVDVFDIGCGPGTFSFAWKSLFSSSKHDYHFIDQSQVMVDQAKKMAEGLFDISNGQYYTAKRFSEIYGVKKSECTSNFKVAIFGHSFNEMGEDVFFQYYHRIKPNLLIFIEPGTPTVFNGLIQLREKLIHDNNYAVLYPCLAEKAACPMANNSSDWCHQIMRTPLSQEVHQLSQRLSIDRRSIALIGHVYLKGEFQKRSGKEKSTHTLVRFLGETKYSWRYLACPIGCAELVELEFLKKLVAKEEKNKISSLCVGDQVLFITSKIVSRDRLRGQIKF